jgi:ribosomal protein S18 acetylase RimI-like enzyme
VAGSLPPIERPDTARPRSDGDPGTGAEPAVPPREELERIEAQLVELAALAGATTSDDAALGASLVRWPGRGSALNHAERVRWPTDPAGVLRHLERLAAELHRSGDRAAVTVARGLTEPHDLAGRLSALGWHATLHELVLWTRSAAAVPHLDPLLRIEAVTRLTAPAYEAFERAVFGLEGSLADARLAAIQRALAAGRLRAYIARVADEPVGTARLWTFGELACVDGVGVVSRARRRGYGTLITTIATRAALATGHRLVWLEVARDNAAARRMYEKLGYRLAFEWDLWVEGKGTRGNRERT